MLDPRDQYGQTPLMWATSFGHLDVVKYFLEKGADLNARSYGDHSYKGEIVHRQNVLQCAFKENKIEIVAALVQTGKANIKEPPISSENPAFTLVHAAAKEGNLKMIKALIEGNPKFDASNLALLLNQKDEDGKTPLMWARSTPTEKHKEVAKYLREKAEFNITTPEEALETLYHLITAHNPYGDSRFINLDEETRLRKTKELLHLFPQVKNRRFRQQSLTYSAVKERDLKILKILVDDFGADINLETEDGQTPVYCCASDKWGSNEILQFLLEKGADASIHWKGWTDYHHKTYGCELYSKPAPKGPDPVYCESDERCLYLYKQGGRHFYKTKQGLFFLEDEDGTTLKDEDGKPLALSHDSFSYFDKKILGAVLKITSDRGHTHLYGFADGTPLAAAVNLNSVEKCRLLIGSGRDLNPNYVMGDGSTALIYAIEGRDDQIVELVLSIPGVDVNHRRDNGESALFIAAKYGKAEKVKLLTSLFLETLEIDAPCKGKTPIQIAKEMGHHDVAKILENALATKKVVSNLKKLLVDANDLLGGPQTGPELGLNSVRKGSIWVDVVVDLKHQMQLTQSCIKELTGPQAIKKLTDKEIVERLATAEECLKSLDIALSNAKSGNYYYLIEDKFNHDTVLINDLNNCNQQLLTIICNIQIEHEIKINSQPSDLDVLKIEFNREKFEKTHTIYGACEWAMSTFSQMNKTYTTLRTDRDTFIKLISSHMDKKMDPIHFKLADPVDEKLNLTRGSLQQRLASLTSEKKSLQDKLVLFKTDNVHAIETDVFGKFFCTFNQLQKDIIQYHNDNEFAAKKSEIKPLKTICERNDETVKAYKDFTADFESTARIFNNNRLIFGEVAPVFSSKPTLPKLTAPAEDNVDIKIWETYQADQEKRLEILALGYNYKGVCKQMDIFFDKEIVTLDNMIAKLKNEIHTVKNTGGNPTLLQEWHDQLISIKQSLLAKVKEIKRYRDISSASIHGLAKTMNEIKIEFEKLHLHYSEVKAHFDTENKVQADALQRELSSLEYTITFAKSNILGNKPKEAKRFSDLRLHKKDRATLEELENKVTAADKFLSLTKQKGTNIEFHIKSKLIAEAKSHKLAIDTVSISASKTLNDKLLPIALEEENVIACGEFAMNYAWKLHDIIIKHDIIGPENKKKELLVHLNELKARSFFPILSFPEVFTAYAASKWFNNLPKDDLKKLEMRLDSDCKCLHQYATYLSEVIYGLSNLQLYPSTCPDQKVDQDLRIEDADLAGQASALQEKLRPFAANLKDIATQALLSKDYLDQLRSGSLFKYEYDIYLNKLKSMMQELNNKETDLVEVFALYKKVEQHKKAEQHLSKHQQVQPILPVVNVIKLGASPSSRSSSSSDESNDANDTSEIELRQDGKTPSSLFNDGKEKKKSPTRKVIETVDTLDRMEVPLQNIMYDDSGSESPRVVSKPVNSLAQPKTPRDLSKITSFFKKTASRKSTTLGSQKPPGPDRHKNT